MNSFRLKSIIKIVFAPVLWLLHGCSPLGQPVNKKLSSNHYYSPSKDDIIYSSGGDWLNSGKTQMLADAESFEVLNQFFGRDKNAVYFNADRIENPSVDVSSFYTKSDTFTSSTGFDKEHVYFIETNNNNNRDLVKIVEQADPETYIGINFDWAKDRSNHFYRGKKLDIAYDSFEILNDHFVSDSSEVFARVREDFKVLNCDKASFRIFKDTKHGIDLSNIYWLPFMTPEKNESIIIPYENIEEVSYLNNFYLSVGSKVYYDGILMPGVTAEKFIIVENAYAKDESHVYYEGAILPDADVATFELRGLIVKDKNGRYEKGKIIEPVTKN